MKRLLPALLFPALLLVPFVPGLSRNIPGVVESIDPIAAGSPADTTEDPEPLSPVDTVLESSTITLAWSVTRDSAYVVELRSDLVDTFETERYSVQVELDTGAYQWRVSGIDSAGVVVPSDWVGFRVRTPLPVPIPLSPIGDTLTAGEVDFVWTTDFDGESEWSLAGDSTWSVVTADTVVTRSLDTGTYTWRVRSTADEAGGAWSEPAALTIVPVADLPVVTPLAPLNRTVGTGLIRLVWISDWRKTFVVEMRGDTTFTESVAAYKLEVALDSEGTYEWRIRAVDGAARGPWSAWWSFSTSDEITHVEETRVIQQLDLH